MVQGVASREALAAVRALDGPERMFALLALAVALEGDECAAALALAGALALPDGERLWMFAGFVPYARELDRRGFATLFERALHQAARDRRERLLADDPDQPPIYRIVDAVHALGGAEAVRDATRSCLAVAAWFP